MPGWNVAQLRALARWARAFPGPRLLVGDLNLPGARAAAGRPAGHSSRAAATYPSWRPRVQFDHVLADGRRVGDATCRSCGWRERPLRARRRPRSLVGDHQLLAAAGSSSARARTGVVLVVEVLPAVVVHPSVLAAFDRIARWPVLLRRRRPGRPCASSRGGKLGAGGAQQVLAGPIIDSRNWCTTNSFCGRPLRGAPAWASQGRRPVELGRVDAADRPKRLLVRTQLPLRVDLRDRRAAGGAAPRSYSLGRAGRPGRAAGRAARTSRF